MFQAVSPRQRAAWVYLFKLLQAVSPRQRVAWVYLCFERSALDNGQLEFIFSNCFERSALDNGQLEFLLSHSKRSVLNNGQLEFIFIFQKNVLPYFIRNNVSPNFFALMSKLSFPVLAEDGVSTISSPDMSDDETSLNFLLKCHSPFCRMTKCQRCHAQCVWSRDVTNQNVCFYKPSVYKIHFKFPNTTINTVVDGHFPQRNYSIP